MNSAAAIFLAAPAPQRGASPQAAEDQDDFGLALQQMLVAPAAAPQPLTQPQIPAEAAADAALMDSLQHLAGSPGKQTGTDAAMPAEEGADADGEELLQLLSQDESALSAMDQEQDTTETKQQGDNARLLQEGRADKAVLPAMQNRTQQEALLPAGMQEQAEEIKTHLTEPQPSSAPATAANTQAQTLNERAAAQHVEKPVMAEGVSRFEQTLTVVRDGNRLQVSLEPDGFGKLDINLSMEQGMLHARIHVADETSRTLLANHQQQLLNALAKEGLNVGGFSVSLRNSGSGQDGQAFRQDRENAAGPWEGQAANGSPDQGSHRGMISIFV